MKFTLLAGIIASVVKADDYDNEYVMLEKRHHKNNVPWEIAHATQKSTTHKYGLKEHSPRRQIRKESSVQH